MRGNTEAGLKHSSDVAVVQLRDNIKNPMRSRNKPRLNVVLPGGDIAAAGDLVQACTSLPRRYSSESRYRCAPACQGIAPRRAGTSLYPHGEELFLAEQQLFDELSLGEQVPACTCSPTNSFSAGWYNLVPARQGVISRRAGTSRSPGATTSSPGKTGCRRGFTGFFYQRP
ncbi:hypothetical protein PCANC_05791 [Puccinia coronata f. sp. avenae]|uniref:Uncharacterized protein n=1 Tax=Puccinia coronata f. sp. avenae TaxID=200324 RepID=A0A2N5VSW0_9BASI|nr:hypothetical protein PCANC_05791 [Puccinia coronata f. sp. avenae]